VGWNDHGQLNVDSWTDIVQVAAGIYHTVGLKSDGTVLVVGWNGSGQCNLGDWNLGVNAAPVANAGANVSITSEQICDTILEGTASDPDDDPLMYRWLERGTELSAWASVGAGGQASLDLCQVWLESGEHTLTLEVTDGKSTSSDEMILTIDNTAPDAAPTGGGSYQIGAPISVGGQVSDFDGDTLAYDWSQGQTNYCSGSIESIEKGTPVDLPACDLPSLGLGKHTLTLTVNDGVNDPVSRSIVIEVVDTEAPTLAPVPNVSILTPVDQRMVAITIEANASDGSGLPVSLSAVVTSDEPREGLGTWDLSPDWTEPVIDGETITLQLRAESSNLGDGRTYTLSITAGDQAGNMTTADVEIVVPQGGPYEVEGDLDGDGDVDQTDYQIFRSALGSSTGNPHFMQECDYDGDGRITYADYRIWYGYYKAYQSSH
jgi:hypothetical protein